MCDVDIAAKSTKISPNLQMFTRLQYSFIKEAIFPRGAESREEEIICSTNDMLA